MEILPVEVIVREHPPIISCAGPSNIAIEIENWYIFRHLN